MAKGTWVTELTEEELGRIDKDGVITIINADKELLKVWSLPYYQRVEIKAEIKDLTRLLRRR